MMQLKTVARFMGLICIFSLTAILLTTPAKAIVTWHFEQITTGGELYSDLEYDQTENPSIVQIDYSTAFPFQVTYLHKTSSGWMTETVGNAVNEPKLSYNPAGQACVLYFESDKLIYAVRTAANTWQLNTVATEPADQYFDARASLAFDSGGRPCVSYVIDSDLFYARFNGTSWVKQLVYSINDIWWPSLGFQSGNPVIAFGGGDEGLKYASFNGSAWAVQTVDAIDSATLRNRAENITLVIGNDLPHISYYDAETEDLKFAFKSGVSWVVKTLESSGNAGYGADMKIFETAGSYDVYIAYQQIITQGQIKIKLKSLRVDDAADLSNSGFTTQDIHTKGYPSMAISLALGGGNPSITFSDYYGHYTKLVSMQPDIASASNGVFGGVLAGSSNSRMITITNNGSMPLSITQIEIPDPSTPFTVTGIDPEDTIASNESKILTVTFAPAPYGTSYQDSIIIHSNDPDEAVYTIALTGRTYSNNADLSGLGLSAGSLTFNPATTEYAVTVNNDTTSIRVTPTAAGTNATIEINGTVVPSGNMSSVLPLWIGLNTVTVLVTAEDPSAQKAYSLSVTRKDSPNASLSSLDISAGFLTPAFSPNVLSYCVTLPDNISDISLTPTAAESHAVINVNGTVVTSGENSSAVSAGIGATMFTVHILAPDAETVKDYSVKVLRLPGLDSLAVSNGLLDTGFDTNLRSYTVTVPSDITSFRVTPTAAAGIDIYVNEDEVASGTNSLPSALDVGDNIITLEAVSADGEAIKTYTVTVNRLAGLSSLMVGDKPVILTPNDYMPTVAITDASARLSAEAPPGMTMKINGQLLENGLPSQFFNFSEGANNTISIEVISPVCTDTATYSLTVLRRPLLTSLTIERRENPSNETAGSTVVALSPDETTYNVTVPNATTSIKLTTTSNNGTSISMSANNAPMTDDGGYVLFFGPNPFQFVVTSADGLASSHYTLVIHRLPGLSSLLVSGSTLSPAFDTDILNYSVSLGHEITAITVTAVSANTIAINNAAADSGIESGAITLNEGFNDISVLVTNDGGPGGPSTATYHINVFRAYSAPTYTADLTGTGTAATLPITVNQASGNAVVTVEALGGAGEGAAPPVISIPSIPGITTYTLQLPTGALNGSEMQNVLTLSTNTGSIMIPGNMLNGIDGADGKTVGITIGQGDGSEMHEDIKAAIGSRPLIHLALTLDGAVVPWQNPSAPVTVSIPYTPTEAELSDPEHITVWYIDGAGNAVSIPSGRYDHATGMVTFSTYHFSEYAVVCVHKTFDDLSGTEWARNSIEVLASKGITQGTGMTTYSPGASITRADFLMLLVKTLGLTADVTDNFADVQPGMYYYEAIGIAKKLGFAAGIGNNQFNPQGALSKQDMITLTAQALAISRGLAAVPVISVLNQYRDAEDIAKHAKDSIAVLVSEGLIIGSGDRLNPQGNTTRAEAAALLYRIYCKY